MNKLQKLLVACLAGSALLPNLVIADEGSAAGSNFSLFFGGSVAKFGKSGGDISKDAMSKAGVSSVSYKAPQITPMFELGFGTYLTENIQAQLVLMKSANITTKLVFKNASDLVKQDKQESKQVVKKLDIFSKEGLENIGSAETANEMWFLNEARKYINNDFLNCIDYIIGSAQKKDASVLETFEGLINFRGDLGFERFNVFTLDKKLAKMKDIVSRYTENIKASPVDSRIARGMVRGRIVALTFDHPDGGQAFAYYGEDLAASDRPERNLSDGDKASILKGFEQLNTLVNQDLSKILEMAQVVENGSKAEQEKKDAKSNNGKITADITSLQARVYFDVADFGAGKVHVGVGTGLAHLKAKCSFDGVTQTKSANNVAFFGGIAASFDIAEGAKAMVEYGYHDFGKAKFKDGLKLRKRSFGANVLSLKIVFPL